MNNLRIILLCFMILTGCTKSRVLPQTSGDFQFDIICLDGVEYIYHLAGAASSVNGGQIMAPHLRTDGKPYLCNSLLPEREGN